PPTSSPLFPYTTLFRSVLCISLRSSCRRSCGRALGRHVALRAGRGTGLIRLAARRALSTPRVARGTALAAIPGCPGAGRPGGRGPRTQPLFLVLDLARAVALGHHLALVDPALDADPAGRRASLDE